jgi:transcriptional regulator with XRE-family HTH domain
MYTQRPLTIRSVRGLNELSQQSLAKIIGISQSKLSAIERGFTSPSGEERRQIAAALGVHISQIAWPSRKDSSQA